DPGHSARGQLAPERVPGGFQARDHGGLVDGDGDERARHRPQSTVPYDRAMPTPTSLALRRTFLPSAALIVLAASARWLPAADPGDAFRRSFTAERTMRVDVFHTGGPSGEIVALDRVVNDGPWPGSRTRLVDDLNLGAFLYTVVDPATNAVLF